MFDDILRLLNASSQGANFPHHFHDEFGQLTASSLSGNPVTDLPEVLTQIENYLLGTRGVS